MRSFAALSVFFLISVQLQAKDLGYRFREGKCQNAQGHTGLNPGYLGQCGELTGAVLGKLDLSEIDLSGSTFAGADIQLTNFAGAILRDVDLSGAQVSGADFSGATVESSNFQRATMRNVSLYNARFSQVDFAGADLSENDFSYAILLACNFKAAKLGRSQFVEADLSGSVLDMSDATASVFTKANLTSTRWRSAKIVNADLRRSILEKADLTDALIGGSDLGNTDLLTAIVSGVRFNRRTVLPISKEEAEARGMMFAVAICQESTDVEFQGYCYYLDGSGGQCDEGFSLSPESDLVKIANFFIGKTYRHSRSNNCCIWTADIDASGENYGLAKDCNGEGPFSAPPVLGGANCTNATNRESKQLTLCRGDS